MSAVDRDGRPNRRSLAELMAGYSHADPNREKAQAMLSPPLADMRRRPIPSRPNPSLGQPDPRPIGGLRPTVVRRPAGYLPGDMFRGRPSRRA